MSAQTVHVEPAVVPAGDLLDEGHARALTARIRTQLEHLDTLLLTAWRGRVWVALGHATWDAWVVAELGTARLRLPIEQRRAVAAAWRREGMSQRAIATGLGVSKGTVAADLADALAGEGLAVVVSLDGRRRPARAAIGRSSSRHVSNPPSPLRPPTRQATALELITAAGEVGVTVPELMVALRWSWSQASACASRLNRAFDFAGARSIERLAERRDGHALYVIPSAVAERFVLRPGQRITRSA